MTREDILKQLNALFKDVLDDESVLITEESTARKVEGWDSVANIRLMLSIEDQFGFKFKPGEFAEYRNVGDLVSGILTHSR